jgi:hypothetical protein
MSEKPGERLAEAVKGRRRHLDIGQTDVARVLGGPGLATVQAIEGGGRGTGIPRRATLVGIDRALRWAPGSAAAVLSGGDPEPLDTTGWPTRDGDWAAYVTRREELDEFERGTDTATVAFAQMRADPEKPRSIGEFSDAEMIAELARRLAAAGPVVTPADDQRD